MIARLRHDRARHYWSLRSAHLERARSWAPASILFAHRNYDFDEATAAGLDLVEGRLPRRLAVLALSRPAVVEVNEPLMRPGIADTAAVVLLVRALRTAGVRTTVVSYAIENRDPFGARPQLDSPKARLRWELDRRLAAVVARGLDRIAFGTPGSAQLYDRRFGERMRAAGALIDALPAPCECLDGPSSVPDRPTAVFVGEFSARKGVPHLLAAWPAVRGTLPDARLVMIGKGPLVDDVRAAADASADITVVEDPPRPRIHEILRAADAVVLLSTATPTWREQVGLPIVEGLGHGCRIVATSQTGLADWLVAHGHEVIDDPADSVAVSAALARALDGSRARQSVLADLPAVDGREAADRWLMQLPVAGQ